MRMLLLLLFLFGIGNAHAEDFKIVLKTAGHDAYPKFYYDYDQNGQKYIAGLGVEILRAIEEIDPALEFDLNPELIPWRRLQNEITTGEVDFFVGLVSNEKRRQLYDMVSTELYRLNHVVAVRKGERYDIQSFDDFVALGSEGSILTLAGSGTVNYMKKQNPDLIILDQAKNIQHGLDLVKRGRADFFYYHDLAIKSVILAHDLEDDIEILPVTFRDYAQYAALSRKVAPHIAKRVKRAIEVIKINGTLDQIFTRYTNRTRAERLISGEFLILPGYP